MVFYWFYGLLYRPLLWLLTILSFFNQKLKKGLSLRKKVDGKWPWLNHPEATKPIWIHCASGEYEYAKPVIRLVKEKYPQEKILVTFFSPSVEKALSNAKDIDFYCPTPWDTSGHWKKFIKHHQPKALLIARTDVWPMMIKQAEKNNIPRLLFSKTMDSNKNGYDKMLMRQLFPKLSDIFCVSEEDRQNLFSEIRPYKNIHTSGDTRYDQCLYRINHGKVLKPLNNFLKPIFVAGSTWSADEEALIPTIHDYIKDVAFIIAPHEPTKSHIESLTKKLKTANLEFCFYSEVNTWDPKKVLIVDEVGILADLYGWAQFSFIGGSMNRSVHSVMESIAHGLLTFVGPKHSNNREAMEFKSQKINDLAPIQVINNRRDMLDNFTQNYKNWSPQHQLNLKILVQKRKGASQLVLKWLENNQLN